MDVGALGSKSTFAAGGFGGFEGRVLKPSDLLKVGASERKPSGLVGRKARDGVIPSFTKTVEVEATVGPQAAPDFVSEDDLDAFFSEVHRVDRNANRLGYRLSPRRWKWARPDGGIAVKHPSQRDLAAPVFLTNSILCIKEGAMNAPILSSWVDACSELHLLPLIAFLRPPVVVGMGNAGWRAVRRTFALHHAPQLISRAAGSCWIAEDRTRVFAVGHCGPLGVINRPWPQQLSDWRQIGAAVSVCPSTGAGLPFGE